MRTREHCATIATIPVNYSLKIEIKRERERERERERDKEREKEERMEELKEGKCVYLFTKR